MTTPRDVADRFVDRIRDVPERFIPVRDAARIVEDIGLVAWSLHATTVFEDESFVLVVSNVSQAPLVSGRKYPSGDPLYVSKKEIDEDAWEMQCNMPVAQERMVLRLIRGERTADLEIVRSAEVAVFKFGWSDESAVRQAPMSIRTPAFIEALVYLLTSRRMSTPPGRTHAESVRRAIEAIRKNPWEKFPLLSRNRPCETE